MVSVYMRMAISPFFKLICIFRFLNFQPAKKGVNVWRVVEIGPMSILILHFLKPSKKQEQIIHAYILIIEVSTSRTGLAKQRIPAWQATNRNSI